MVRGYSKEYEKEYIKKDGTLLPISIRSWLTKDKQGKPVGTWAIVRDITERKQAEEKLLKKQYYLTKAQEMGIIGTWELDIQKNILIWTDENYKIFGVPLGTEMNYEIFLNCVHPDDRDYVHEKWSAGLNHEPYDIEHRLIVNDKVKWVREKADIEFDKEGKPIMAIGFTQDVTERKKSEEKLKKTMDATIETLSKTIEAKDPYTSGHQHRVCQLTVPLAQELGLAKDKIEGIRIASLIHDIGKIGLPTETLSKPSKLTDIEFSLIKGHSQIGYDILKSIDFSYPIAQIVLQHHERINGTGYPNNLKGDKILLEAKIIGIADVVEAMSSYRPYRPALGIDKALEEISKNRGTLYDPEVVDVCLKLFKGKEFKF
jgi:PAS domain S-box-containing protein